MEADADRITFVFIRAKVRIVASGNHSRGACPEIESPHAGLAFVHALGGQTDSPARGAQKPLERTHPPVGAAALRGNQEAMNSLFPS